MYHGATDRRISQEIPSLFSWNTQIVCNLWMAAAKRVMESCNGSWCSSGLPYLCKVKRRSCGDISNGWQQERGKAGIMEMESKMWMMNGRVKRLLPWIWIAGWRLSHFTVQVWRGIACALGTLQWNGPMVIIHIACVNALCSKASHPLWWLVENKAVT